MDGPLSLLRISLCRQVPCARYRLRRHHLDVTPALCLNSQRYLDFGVVFLVVQDDGNVTGDVLVLLRSVEGVRGVGGGQPGSGLRGRGRRQVGRLRRIR